MQVVKKINHDEISKFKPFVRYYIIGSTLCTVIMILVTLDLFSPGEDITFRDKLLLVFNFVFIVLEIGFYFIVRKGINYFKNYNGRLNKDINIEAMDLVFNVRNKFKFIKDAEEMINNNIENKYALIHYDIKKFSIINNSVGYKVGDDILKKICKIFTKELKDEVFEKNGFIIKLDKYVFEQVCANMRKWIDKGYEVVPVSVNVSRIHFLNTDFVQEYNRIKEKYSIPDNLIEIEITESVVFNNDNEENIFTVMKNFKDEGFEISMDDFGSGYSSLGLLRKCL